MTGPSFDPPAEVAEAATALFGERLPLAAEYARRLATDGVVRGLIGPRETERLWGRHLLNCAAVSELAPSEASVTDVGSGAGLPGLVLAVARPDLTVVLVEPLARRVDFLSEVVDDLGLDNVSVVRARAEDATDLSPTDVVTARAVAPLDRLAAWCLPLARVGGRLLALKGATAADEVAAHRDAIARLGGGDPVIRSCGVGLLPEPTTVVEVVRERDVTPAAKRPRGAGAVRSRGGSRSRSGSGPRPPRR
ncbi:16S rRNA (guanine(527)-N(7))-methyltransferase RsmG [Planosporangium mesophilum]|uniref:Ribosomal RNA small subunit methyltransferase G n=1 Tax=Planosporangium mesophilum TaxID=689768 RepID=A0A8J3X2V8_9ACTN|nr:16S rRNA (guanine(527)-N(7))-methyltransferase RsmG [Planosporangium mesophilum]GII22278.1 ribosomal RNA small subunit methyltransferase G [Planosporangium mesophilum]